MANRRNSIRFAGVLASCFVLTWASVGAAAEPDRKAAAQALFEEGRSLVREGKFAQACPKFAQSLKLDAGIGAMLWLADCYENAGQTASAWAQFKEAAATAALSHDPREKVARRRVEALEARLTKVVISVAPDAKVPGLEVQRDGVPVGDAEFGMAIPLDPGHHVVSATATGRVLWSVDVEVPPRPESVVVDVPVLARKAPAPVATSEPRAATQVEASSSGSTMRVVGLATAGAGVVAIGVGAFLGLKAKSTYDASNSDNHCNAANVCDTEGKEYRSSASGLATGATIAFGAGIAAVAGGIILYFLAPRDVKPAVGVRPMMGPRGGGLVLLHTF